MGLKLFGSSCSCEPRISLPPRTLPNPDPKNWVFLDHRQMGNYLALKLHYPDCTNFEGDKILVFEAQLKDVITRQAIDPHFCDNGHLSPIARFEPTQEGWDDAVSYCQFKHKGEYND